LLIGDIDFKRNGMQKNTLEQIKTGNLISEVKWVNYICQGVGRIIKQIKSNVAILGVFQPRAK